MRSGAVRLCGGVGGGAPVNERRTPAQQNANKPLPREDACGVGRAIDGVFCKGRSQTNKETNKETKQTNKQTNKQRGTEHTASQTHFHQMAGKSGLCGDFMAFAMLMPNQCAGNAIQWKERRCE